GFACDPSAFREPGRAVPRPNPMERHRPLTRSISKAPRQLLRRLNALFVSWGYPEFSASARLEFSSRLRRTVGRCYPARGLIRLSSALLDRLNRHLIAEVIAHEAAHFAVHRVYGAK